MELKFLLVDENNWQECVSPYNNNKTDICNIEVQLIYNITLVWGVQYIDAVFL